MWRTPELTEELLDEMVRVIVDTVDPEQVILFGSRATGKAGPDSDVDLLVVEPEPFNSQRNSWDEEVKLSRALAHVMVPIDILVFSRDEVEHWRESKNHVIGRAQREGKVLYERS